MIACHLRDIVAQEEVRGALDRGQKIRVSTYSYPALPLSLDSASCV